MSAVENWQGECGPEVARCSWGTALREAWDSHRCCTRTPCSHDYRHNSATTMFMRCKAAGIDTAANRIHTLSGWSVSRWAVNPTPMHNAEYLSTHKCGAHSASPRLIVTFSIRKWSAHGAEPDECRSSTSLPHLHITDP